MTNPAEALAYYAEQERQRILAYEAGPELDALVQRRVFKTGIYEYSGVKRIVVNEPHALEAELIPPYSTEAGAAMAVVAHLNAQGLMFELFMQGDGDSAARFFRERKEADMPWHGYWATGPKMPIATVRAALLAVAEARR